MATPTDALTAGNAARAARARVPDFFVVGHHKCGTTALYEMLCQHPQVFMSTLKEPRFLASDMELRFPQKLDTAHGRQMTRAYRETPYPKTLEEYLALFADAAPGQKVGEATATYLWSHTAAEAIASLQPDARIIAILREPARFLHSLHLHYLRAQVESQTNLRKAIKLEPARREGRRIPRDSHLPQLLFYTEQVRFTDMLRRYHEHFPRERVLVLIYDDFRADNQATLRQVYRFLGVDEEHPVQSVAANVTEKTMRSPQVEGAMFSVSMGDSSLTRAAKVAVKGFTTQRLRHLTMGAIQRRIVVGDAPPPDERLMLELRRRFKPDVVELSEYLGRDLVKLWGYDKLG